ncbi:thioesterase family protein [Kribbella deserti]|uniref:Thioesterase family protein n=1 Tax=Kribbella deserti TaxID=1926257 RepID=A0ABV6QML3_9ACTN
MSEFETDTAVESTGDGVYTATVTDRWNAVSGRPNGGHLLAIALRALSAELPQPDPLVVSAFFLRPGLIGPATIQTSVVRAGRRVATGEARLSQDGKEVIRLTASYLDFGQTAGRTAILGQAPELPAPEDCVNPIPPGGVPGVTVVDRFEFRYAEVPGWFRGKPGHAPTSEFWVRFIDGHEPDGVGLAALVDSAAPAVLDFGVLNSSTIELTVHLRARPAPGWLACRVSTRYVIDGLHEEDFEIWDSKGDLVAQSRQLGLLTEPPAAP